MFFSFSQLYNYSFNVDFYDNDEKIGTQIVSYNNKVNTDYVPIVSKEGYDFKYWSEDKTTEFDFNTKAGDIKIISVKQKEREDRVTDGDKLTIFRQEKPEKPLFHYNFKVGGL